MIKKNSIVNLSVGILFLNLIMPILLGIFSPYTILYSEKIYFVIVELLIFNILNYLFLKIKNSNIKKILIFISIFIYLPGYNIMLLFTSLVYQSLNSKKERYILINIFNILAYFIWYFRSFGLINSLKNNNLYLIIYFLLLSVIIIFILFLIWKKEIYKSKELEKIYNMCIFGILIHILIYQYLDKYTNFDIVCEDYINKTNETLMSIFNLLYDHYEVSFILSFVCILIMFLFYYYNISIYENEIRMFIIVIFLLNLKVIFSYDIYNKPEPKNYFIMIFVFLIYVMNYIKRKYIKIRGYSYEKIK